MLYQEERLLTPFTWVSFKEMISGDTFNFLDHIREPYVWNGLNKKMNMVFVDTDL